MFALAQLFHMHISVTIGKYEKKTLGGGGWKRAHEKHF